MFRCFYSGCHGAPAHDEAREMIGAIATTRQAIDVLFKLQRLEMSEAAREEHAAQAVAIWRELDEAAHAGPPCEVAA